jgi:iron complex transport system substrate-binding protein
MSEPTASNATWRRATVPLLLLAVVLVSAVVSGCSSAPSSSAASELASTDAALAASTVTPLANTALPELPVTVPGDGGRDVRVDDVARIVPLSSGVAEIVFTLGLGDRVVGRDIGTTFVQAQDLPLVTRAHDVSAEGVLSLRPTIVIADAGVGPPEALQQIRDTGVPVVVVPEAWELGDIAPRIRAVAKALGVPDDGERLVKRTQDDIERARTTLRGNPTIAFLYLRGQASVYLLGGDGAGADSLIEALGAVDAGTKDGLTTFTPLTAEAMVSAQPDVLLVMTKGLDSVGGIDGVKKLPGIAQTPAGREGRIVAVDDGLLLAFGPRTGAVLQLIAQGVNDLDLDTAATTA